MQALRLSNALWMTPSVPSVVRFAERAVGLAAVQFDDVEQSAIAGVDGDAVAGKTSEPG